MLKTIAQNSKFFKGKIRKGYGKFLKNKLKYNKFL